MMSLLRIQSTQKLLISTTTTGSTRRCIFQKSSLVAAGEQLLLLDNNQQYSSQKKNERQFHHSLRPFSALPSSNNLLLNRQRYSFHTSSHLLKAEKEEKTAEKKETKKQPPAAKEAAEEKPKEEAASEEKKETPAAAPSSDGGDKQYSTPELTKDAAAHKKGLEEGTDIPAYQNPLHHENEDMKKTFPNDFASKEEFEQATVAAPPLEPADGSVAAPEYLKEIANEIVHLTMLEMNELINKIADHYQFNESMLSPDGDDALGGDDDAVDGEGGEAAQPVQEKTTFDIKLVEFDAKAKIKVIKEVRSLAGLGLKEAKEMVEGAPKVIHKGLKKEEAEEIKAKLEEIGAKIELV